MHARRRYADAFKFELLGQAVRGQRSAMEAGQAVLCG